MERTQENVQSLTAMQLIFATHNPHKIDEINPLLHPGIGIITLDQAGITEEIPEPYDTLEENASAKSRFVFNKTGMNCFSEDTGLEVESLGGAPGAKSARYAGDGRSFEKNMDKLLQELAEKEDRKAQFRTVISLIIDGREYLFEGICRGHIARQKSGNGGFGYDPLFIPEGHNRTFAEMSLEEKSKLSHRAIAVGKLVIFLNQLITNR